LLPLRDRTLFPVDFKKTSAANNPKAVFPEEFLRKRSATSDQGVT
jgi:hypothetical protein